MFNGVLVLGNNADSSSVPATRTVILYPNAVLLVPQALTRASISYSGLLMMNGLVGDRFSMPCLLTNNFARIMPPPNIAAVYLC